MTAELLYQESGIGPEEVDILECMTPLPLPSFSIMSVWGYVKKGKDLNFLRDGQSTYGGKCVVSPRGGMLSYGHPIGASGAAQIASNVKQLRENAPGIRWNRYPKCSHVPCDRRRTVRNGTCGMYDAHAGVGNLRFEIDSSFNIHHLQWGVSIMDMVKERVALISRHNDEIGRAISRSVCRERSKGGRH